MDKIIKDANKFHESKIILTYLEALKQKEISKNGEIEKNSKIDKILKLGYKYINSIDPLVDK